MRGWTVTVECPHGAKHQLPLSWVYNMRPPEDQCPEAARERAQGKSALPEPSDRKVRRDLRRLERRMRKGKL